MTTNEELNLLVVKCKSIMDSCGLVLPQNITYSMNARFTKSMGRCKKTTRGLNVSYQIELAKCYFEEYMKQGKYMEMEDTILHEMCHTLPNCFDHGDEWLRVVGIVNKNFGYHIKRCYESDEVVYKVKASKYPSSELCCTKCGRKSIHKNTSVYIKHPKNYRCNCGGSFEVKEVSFDN